MNIFEMKYEDAKRIAQASYEKDIEKWERYSQTALDGFEKFAYDAVRAYKYITEGTHETFDYGIGVLSDGISNGSLFVEKSIEETANYVKEHFEVDIPTEEIPTFLYNVGNEIYNYFTDETLPEGGLTTAIVLPATTVNDALNLNLPVELYTRLKDYIHMHYSEEKASVTLPNGTTYNNVVGGSFYGNLEVNIEKVHFSKTWLYEKMIYAAQNCQFISAERSVAIVNNIVSNIDTIYSDIIATIPPVDYIFDLMSISCGKYSATYFYRFIMYPVFSSELETDYFKGDYGNSAVVEHSDGSLSLLFLRSKPNNSPLYIEFNTTTPEVNNFAYSNHISRSGATADIDPHNSAFSVDTFSSTYIYSTYSALPNIPTPEARGNILPLIALPDEPIEVLQSPERPTSATPAPIPEPPSWGNLSPFIPPETDIQLGMGAVYNPSIFQVRDLALYLWSPDFLDLFKKFFTDPKDAIVSLHKVYVTPSAALTGIPDNNIYCGYVKTSVENVKHVTNQYTHLDCGTAYIPEYYGSARDYIASDLKLYLPFIGIVTVDINEFLGRTMHIYYNVDVLTGACAAFVSAISGETEKLLYTYSGNCSVTIPISSGSYLTNWQSLIESAMQLSTGNVLGAAMTTAGNIGNNVHRSGSLSSNIGAMSPRKPFALITRKVPNEWERDASLEVYDLNKPIADIETFIASANDNDLIVISDYKAEIKSGNYATANELNNLGAILQKGVYK